MWTQVDVFELKERANGKRGRARTGISGCVDKHTSEARGKGGPGQSIQTQSEIAETRCW